jgi:YD repeat-containing protein
MPFPIRGLSKTKISKGSNQLIDNFVVDSYDINNKDFNPSQTSNEVGVKTSYIWGYNKTKLIAKIENCELTTLPLNDLMNIQSLSNSDNDTCTSGTCNEQFLRNALNGLRTTLASSNPNARMTSYTYNPLVGVTSVTDAKSDVQYYIYDSFQRLIKVVDKDNKIVSENAYNYKPQN